MVQQQQSRSNTSGESNGMAVEPAWAVQMKQEEVDGLPLNEQQERLKPAMPLQYSVQFNEDTSPSTEDEEKLSEEEAQEIDGSPGRITLITPQKYGGCRLRIEADVHHGRFRQRREDWPLSKGDTGMIGGEYACVVTAVGADFNLAFTGATLKQLKSVENKAIFGVGVKGEDEPVATQEVGEEEGREESEETPRSGSVEEGEEQTSQTEDQESNGESEGDDGQTDEQEHEQSQYYLDQHEFIAAIDSENKGIYVETRDRVKRNVKEDRKKPRQDRVYVNFWSDVAKILADGAPDKLDDDQKRRLRILAKWERARGGMIPETLDHEIGDLHGTRGWIGLYD